MIVTAIAARPVPPMPMPSEVGIRPAIIAVVVIKIAHKPGTLEPATDEIAAVVKQCHSEGVLVLTAGTYGNVVRLLPPITIDDTLLDEGLEVLEESLAGA